MDLRNALGRIRTADLLARTFRAPSPQSGNRIVSLAAYRAKRAKIGRNGVLNGKRMANGPRRITTFECVELLRDLKGRGGAA